MTNATFDVIFDNAGSNGTPGANTVVTTGALGPPTVQFKAHDDALIDALYKVTITTGQTIYSYVKALYIKCTANASSHTMNNVKIHSDGSNTLGTGVDVKVGLQFPVRYYSGIAYYTGYKLATSQTEMTAGEYTGTVTSTATIFNYSSPASGLAVTIDAANQGGVIDAVNETCYYVILQLSVTDSASPGTTTNETGTFAYDEA